MPYYFEYHLIGVHQTPSLYHCHHNRSGYDGDKFIRRSKICMTQYKLMIWGSDYVTRPGLLKSKHQIPFVEFLTVKNGQRYLHPQRMYSGNTSALYLGFPQSSHLSWQLRFNFSGDNVMRSTIIYWTVTQILVPQCILLQHIQFPIMGHKPWLHEKRYPAYWLCLYLKTS